MSAEHTSHDVHDGHRSAMTDGDPGHHEHSGHEADDSGHDKHAGHSVAMFRDRFWLSLALTIPVVYFSETVEGWFG